MKDYSAFPVVAPDHGPIMTGLSKREYFAAMAMQGLISQAQSCEGARDKYTVNGGWVHHETIATNAIQIADELLKQLEA